MLSIFCHGSAAYMGLAHRCTGVHQQHPKQSTFCWQKPYTLRFATRLTVIAGDWEAAQRREEAEPGAEDDEDEVFGDFEDVETGKLSSLLLVLSYVWVAVYRFATWFVPLHERAACILRVSFAEVTSGPVLKLSTMRYPHVMPCATGEKFGGGDAVTAAAAAAIKSAAAEEAAGKRAEDKAAKKAAFDSEYDVGKCFGTQMQRHQCLHGEECSHGEVHEAEPQTTSAQQWNESSNGC